MQNNKDKVLSNNGKSTDSSAIIKPPQCDKCHVIFATENKYWNHQRKKACVIEKVRCKKCNRLLASESSVKMHLDKDQCPYNQWVSLKIAVFFFLIPF